MDIDKFFFLCIIAILILASINDLFYKKIPNWLTFSSLLFGIIFQSVFRGYDGFLFSLQGIGIGFVIPFIIYLAGGFGAGDVKLMAAIGSFVGPKEIFIIFIFSSLLSGIWAIILLSIHGFIFQTLKRYYNILKTLFFTRQLVYIPPLSGEKKLKIRFGIMVALGTLFMELYGSVLPVNYLYFRF
jgi:prepilin peptidase CpaA